MTWWDKLRAITRREAGAVREGAGRAAEALDEALAKKERKLAATPAERVDMVLDEIAVADAHFDEIETKLRTEGAERSARAGLEPPPPAAAAPDHASIRDTLTVKATATDTSADRMSHIVMIDGQLLATLRSAGVDAVVADLLAEVMVLDAARRGDDILLRTPTLTDYEVADLVARVAVHHLPTPAPPPFKEPHDKTTGEQGYSEL
jgi:hypothetical protein